MTCRRIALSLLTLSAPLAPAASADEEPALETVVVTAVQMKRPLTVETDPKLPRQPLPAHDGADYLKTIPGFNVIRKGGTSGDPTFRGMAASRINVLLDGEALLGGCGMRMDPPTAYVFPEAYDRITVIKGPQTVLHGPGNSAATVLFERDPRHLAETGWQVDGSVTGASFGRHDEVLNVVAGTPAVYAALTGTQARSDNYEDGSGTEVHSRYERWSANAALGWTPDADTSVVLSGALSDGEAAYADRMMDGSGFDRENLALKFNRDDVSQRIRSLEAQVYYNYIDHVMDNYSLRRFTPSMMMPFPAASNPDRRTVGGRGLMELAFGEALSARIGLDYQANEHSVRSTMNQTMMRYQDMRRADDAEFRNQGLFGELHYAAEPRSRWIAGLRIDDWEARDERETLGLAMGMRMPNPTANAKRDETLGSGFLRHERDLSVAPATLYAGFGRAERFPDYWEAIGDKESTGSLSAFDTRPEDTRQLDIGAIYGAERLSASLSAFYSDVEDYILIESNYAKGMRNTVVTRNIDARMWGGELGLGYALAPNWRADLTLAYTRGENDTDDRALAQQPPLESRISLNYEGSTWSFGALLRVVDEQDRVAMNQGNVVGQDLGETDGFAVLSFNAGWRSGDTLRLTAGIDNVLDETYAEHLSRGGAMVAGFTQTERVNEPGRTAWLRVAFDLN